jgi:phosphatidylinositol alpha-mannosyltransferase
LDRRKALDVLLRVFSRLSGRGADAILILAGPDDGELKMLEGLSKSLEIEARVQFLGMVDSEERAFLLAAADVLTLTSIAENFGNSGAEAMAAGVAVLISDQCGVAEGVEEGGVGRVVEVDEDAMVCALDEMLADTESLRQMGARGPSFAESRYAAGEVAKSFALAYADLLSGSRSAQCRWSDG